MPWSPAVSDLVGWRYDRRDHLVEWGWGHVSTFSDRRTNGQEALSSVKAMQ